MIVYPWSVDFATLKSLTYETYTSKIINISLLLLLLLLLLQIIVLLSSSIYLLHVLKLYFSF